MSNGPDLKPKEICGEYGIVGATMSARVRKGADYWRDRFTRALARVDKDRGVAPTASAART